MSAAKNKYTLKRIPTSVHFHPRLYSLDVITCSPDVRVQYLYAVKSKKGKEKARKSGKRESHKCEKEESRGRGGRKDIVKCH